MKIIDLDERAFCLNMAILIDLKKDHPKSAEDIDYILKNLAESLFATHNPIAINMMNEMVKLEMLKIADRRMNGGRN